MNTQTNEHSSATVIQEVFSAKNHVSYVLEVECALAHVKTQHQLISAAALRAICLACEQQGKEPLNPEESPALTQIALPLVRQLRMRIQTVDASVDAQLNLETTAQDVTDTALILQLREALCALQTDLLLLNAALAAQAKTHQHTPMATRNWMQHSLPTTFGMKAAGWLDAMLRHQMRLSALAQQVLVLQCGDATGMLNGLGDKTEAVSHDLAQLLGLNLPDIPWHTQRDRLVEVATTAGLLVASLAKIAREISLLAQPEVAELAEPQIAATHSGKAQDASACSTVIATANRIPALISLMLTGMVQEHERATGSWQTEWHTLPEILQLTANALTQMKNLIEGLQVDSARMTEHLEQSQEQVMVEAIHLELAQHIGRQQAQQHMERFCMQLRESGLPVRESLLNDALIIQHLGREKLACLLHPGRYAVQAVHYVDKVLHTWRIQNGNVFAPFAEGTVF